MFYIGIDLGGTFIKGGIVNENHEVVLKKAKETRVSEGPAAVLSYMEALIRELIADNPLKEEACGGIGIGSPGTIDSTNGIVLYSNNFDWENVDMAGYLKEKFPYPIRISNDANCAALGELLADDEGEYKSAVLLTLGTGVGSGLVLGGKLYEGENPGAAELGHTVIRHNGRQCSCGRRGCLEAYASATALIKEGEKVARSFPASYLGKYYEEHGTLNGKVITDAVRNGDSAALDIYEEYLEYLGEGIVNIVNIFRPDVVYLGGGVCESFDLMEESLNSFVYKYSFGGKYAKVAKIQKAKHGNDAGIIGAAGLLL